MPPTKLLMQISGAPGSRKSTLAKMLWYHIGGIIIDHDVLRSSLLETATIPFDDASKQAYYSSGIWPRLLQSIKASASSLTAPTGTRLNEDARAVFVRWVNSPCRPNADNGIILDPTESPERLCEQVVKKVARLVESVSTTLVSGGLNGNFRSERMDGGVRFFSADLVNSHHIGMHGTASSGGIETELAGDSRVFRPEPFGNGRISFNAGQAGGEDPTLPQRASVDV